MEAINLIQWNHNMELNCKYIYMLQACYDPLECGHYK